MMGIVRNKNGRFVGQVKDGIFIKTVYGTRHMLKEPMAWAIDKDIFDSVIAPNCGAIHIIDTENGKRYICGVKTFTANRKLLNRKHGDQYYLELVYWSVK